MKRENRDKTDRVMVDIETLGTETGSAILSIGAALFDVDGVRETFHRSISLTSCQEAGLSIDAETLQWWLEQDEQAQGVLTGGDDLTRVLSEFGCWYRSHDVDEVWANSPSFDCEMLEHAFDIVGIKTPWEFYEERDFRTLKELHFAADVDQQGVEHDALDDAVYQAQVVAKTLKTTEIES